MSDLHQMKCVACRAGEPALTEDEIHTLHPQIPEWQIKEVDGVKRLERVCKFKNFAQALEFTNKVGAIAEGPSSLDYYGIRENHPRLVDA